MSLLQTVSPSEATGGTAEIYAAVKEKLGFVPNSLQLMSVNPMVLKGQVECINYMMNHDTLPQSLLAVIRMLVSADSNCQYCIDFNAAMLINHFEWTTDQVEAARKNPADANLKENEKALLLFVLKAIQMPHAVTAEDISMLRSKGWSELDIFDATLQGARMKSVDILIDAFKVEEN